MFGGKLQVFIGNDCVSGYLLGAAPDGTPVSHVATQKIEQTPAQLGQKLYRASLSPEPALRNFAVAKVALLRERATRGVARAKAVVEAFDKEAGAPTVAPAPAAPAAVKDAVATVKGELLDVSGYFPTHALVGLDRAAFAKKLAARIIAKDEKAIAKFRDIRARAKAGKSAAQDVVYAVRRYLKEAEPPAAEVKITEANAMGFNSDALEGFVESRSGDPRIMLGLHMWEGLHHKKSRDKCMKHYRKAKEYAAAGDADAAVVSGTVALMAKAERERRAKRRRGRRGGQAVVLGFDFGSFMNDVGKVAGPIAKSLAPMAKFVPFVGPLLEPALNVVGDVASGSDAAKRKVETVKKLAASGNPTAKKDLLALKMAVKIRKGAAIAKTVKAAKAGAGRRYRAPMFKRILISLMPYRAGSRRVGVKVKVKARRSA